MKSGEAWVADLAARFPVTATGRRADWITIAQRYRKNPFLRLADLGGPFGRDHTYVLHALRTMGIYEERNTPEWKEKVARVRRERERKRKYDQIRSQRRAEARQKRIAAEGTRAPFNAKITKTEVKHIQTLYNIGMERKQIARLFKVSPSLVWKIGSGEKWKDLSR
jgi:hypothetical protein